MLLALPVKFYGIELQHLCEEENIKLLNSKEIARKSYENVTTQDKSFQIENQLKTNFKNELKTTKI